MKEKKTKEIEYAFEALFEDPWREANDLRNSHDSKFVSSIPDEALPSARLQNLFTALRQVFLFFPGTFVLWGMTAEFTYMTLMGGQPFQPDPIAVLTISFFMVLFGLGDVRRGKDYVMPLSIMGVGILMATLAWVTGPQLWSGRFVFLFFPAALIVPFIAKYWVDSLDHEE